MATPRPKLSALDSVVNDLKSAAEVPAIIEAERVLVPDETTIAKNRELKQRIIELEERLERERREYRADAANFSQSASRSGC